MRARELAGHIRADESVAADVARFGPGIARHAIHCGILPSWQNRAAFIASPFYLYAPTSGESWEKYSVFIMERTAKQLDMTTYQLYQPRSVNCLEPERSTHEGNRASTVRT